MDGIADSKRRSQCQLLAQMLTALARSAVAHQTRNELTSVSSDPVYLVDKELAERRHQLHALGIIIV